MGLRIDLLGKNIAALTHDGSHRQPDAVVHVPNVLELLGFLVARVTRLPIVWRHSTVEKLA